MNGLGERATETGFTLPEIEALTTRIEDALDEDFLDGELGKIEETFNVTLDFRIYQGTRQGRTGRAYDRGGTEGGMRHGMQLRKPSHSVQSPGTL